MTVKPIPEWFVLLDDATPQTIQRLVTSVETLDLPLQVRFLPQQALWFLLNSLQIANVANREGKHANALSITRQTIEAMSIVEIGLISSDAAADVLSAWEEDKLTPGELRRWLERNAWSSYGPGLWVEPWSEFMSKLARAVQPYAHYSAKLAQWQMRIHGPPTEDADGSLTFLGEFGPAAYDPQKATRITLYHALLTFALARIWMVTAKSVDNGFADLISRFRVALGKSAYLDGDQTNWDQQFWAVLLFKGGRNDPE